MSEQASVILGVIGIIGIIMIVAGVAGAVETDKKKRLAAIPQEISAALAKAQKAATACLEMQKAAVLAEASFTAAGIDDKQWKSSDGPRGEELLAKTKDTSIKAMADIKRLSVEAVKLLPTSPHYVNLRTYCWLAHTACEACDPHLCQGNCRAFDILNKIELT